MTITTTLPGLTVSWSKPTYDPEDWTFDHYEVWRRVAAALDPWGQASDPGAWVTVASIDDDDTTSYLDVHVGAGVVYEYAVIWVGHNGVDLVPSDPQSPLVSEGVSWSRGLMLHEVGNPDVYVPVSGTALGLRPEQEQVRVRARGAQQGTTFVGRALEDVVEISIAPEYHGDPAVWQALRLMLERQFTHNALFCLRPAHGGGEVWFGSIEEIERGDRPGLYEPRLRFRQSRYSEEVA